MWLENKKDDRKKETVRQKYQKNDQVVYERVLIAKFG